MIYSEISSISSEDEMALQVLLSESFPGFFDERCYFKQEPHSRIVARSEGKIVGQVGIDRRVVNVAGTIVKLLGIIDLCVSPTVRNKGIGTALLKEVEKRSLGRDFIVLMADDASIYRRVGYHNLRPALTRWLAIENLESHRIIERDLSDCFMYKPLAAKSWPDGKIDMLGYLF